VDKCPADGERYSDAPGGFSSGFWYFNRGTSGWTAFSDGLRLWLRCAESKKDTRLRLLTNARNRARLLSDDRERPTMKFMLMMHAPRGKGDWAVFDWPPEALKAHIDFMMRFNKELGEAGELVGAEGLDMPSQARIVRASGSGTPEVTDGPFAEAKEFLAGYWIVDVENPARAYAIAAQASAAPGPKGTPLNMPIEVRQVMSGPPADA
jgi:hypothetical protein